jgi:hypothetical protein
VFWVVLQLVLGWSRHTRPPARRLDFVLRSAARSARAGAARSAIVRRKSFIMFAVGDCIHDEVKDIKENKRSDT